MPDHPYLFLLLIGVWLYWFGIAMAMGVKLLRMHPATLDSWFARGMIAVELAAALVGLYLVLVQSIRPQTATDTTLMLWAICGGGLGILYVASLYRIENERRRAQGRPVLKSFFGR